MTVTDLATGDIITELWTDAVYACLGDVWTSYTPTWTGITTGNGTNSGSYKSVGKIVFYRSSFIFGSTSVVTGPIYLSIPGTMANTSNFSADVKYNDAGISWYPGFAIPYTTTSMSLTALVASGTYLSPTNLSSTVPITWGILDGIYVQGWYSAA